MDGTCGPRQRSMKSPSRIERHVLVGGNGGNQLGLVLSPMSRKNLTASSRAQTSRVTGMSRFQFAHALLDRRESSGVNGREKAKS